jgi:hypothetical protein
MFVILGFAFYFLFKDQDPSQMMDQIKEKSNMVTKAVREKLKSTDKANVKN